MHLLATQPGTLSDGSEAVDLEQTPGAVVFLSSADTELAAVATAYQRISPSFSLRMANLGRLGHPLSVDLYLDRVVSQARVVVLRLLGGRSYWSYGLEQMSTLCRRRNILLACLPGDDKPDPDLMRESTLPPPVLERLWRALSLGGPVNTEQILQTLARLQGLPSEEDTLHPLPVAGVYPERSPWTPDPDRASIAVVFYRSLMLAGDTAPIDALLDALRQRGLHPRAMFVPSLKDPVAAAVVESLLAEMRPAVILNTTGFAVATPAKAEASPFAASDCPVFQVVLAGGSEASWAAGTHGLGPRDIAMNVALPEVDGRLLTRAISFKAAVRDPMTECDIAHHQPVKDRVAFVADLAASWARLRQTAVSERRVAVVLANYPNRDGRVGNGVGLDTPAATVEILHALAQAGYGVEDVPADGNTLLRRLQDGPTNDWRKLAERERRETLPLSDYTAFFATLPSSVQIKVQERWGDPKSDPFCDGSEGFRLPLLRLGQVVVGIQPARGYNIDPVRSYHDPALTPPHSYFAFYAWLRHHFRVHALLHMGKHGTLEWLPGKALALSEACFPEAVLGPLPHLYPFIVNDPGEGTQAKRRAQAVIVSHLTPPLTRAETYGPLRDLEALVDEYYDAAGLDPRRMALLRREILALVSVTGLDRDLGISTTDDPDAALARLDNHLCELKELQIRDGLHIFGRSPQGRQRIDLLVALARMPRGNRAEDASLTRALACDLGLAGFDPLDCHLGDPWSGPHPAALKTCLATPWRTVGDTVERLETLATALVEESQTCPPAWSATAAVLAGLRTGLAPAVDACGAEERRSLLAGLEGRFVPPGPSGAPSRGRPDVLPTGKNFFSVDTRTVPTPTAWTLGWASATLLLERHLQDHGAWPKTLALTVWGTSTMRTGGDDIAQGLALLGVRPCWDTASRRVTGFEILPHEVLDRPRVDVTLRISGFFRDAFPDLIALFDSAVRAVAALEEPEDINPLAARVRAETPEIGAARAGARIFGSQPGAYGAGLQALIDERGWNTPADLAEAYITWGGWAYGAGAEGVAEHTLFRTRLAQVQAVVQNQDNREHDLLDSDDYYQFEGGLTAAVTHASGGVSPVVYHMDHSRPHAPRAYTLEEEIARVVRARAVNPKWIAGVMRHGYKGGFEMAATVDYLFAFAVTTKAVGSHHFDLIADAYLGDETVRDFLHENNPAALEEIQARLREALERGLWQPRRNCVHAWLSSLS